ncbi:MAG: 4-hydroxy-3-methylbut-2-enyl diphosphate reductase [Brevinema sp.]
MIVLVPKTSGFCPGVKRAEDGVFKLREESEQVHLYGPLIHNQNYIEMLRDHHINAVDPESLAQGETLVIRTHGISRFKEEELSKKFILKDMTCPIVKRVQKHVDKSSQQDSFVIISGKNNHAEVQGLVSYAQHYLVIENEDELQQFLKQGEIPQNCLQIAILSQTTHSREFFQRVCDQIKDRFADIPIIVHDTICPVTENKEQESLTLQQEVDFTVVIGDPTSSNSKKLYQILKNASEKTIFTQNLATLKNQKSQWDGIQKVLVVSSTSTPLFVEKEVIHYLEQL